jgi:hexosaminidase
MKKIISIVFLCFVSFLAFAQKPPVSALHLNYEIVRNDVGGKRIFLSALTLSNKSNMALPASGWSIFFNFPRLIHSASVSPKMQVEHINGDFYRMTPTAQFTGLRPTDTVRVEFTAGAWGTSITDAPGGIYLVWDEEPAKGHLFSNYTAQPATRPEQYNRYAGDKYEVYTPEKVFRENEGITDIPAGQLTKIFPTPASYRETGGTFLLDRNVPVKVMFSMPTDPGREQVKIFDNEMDLLLRDLDQILVRGKGKSKGVIMLKQNDSIRGEGYRLNVTPNEVRIEASTPVGIFYGIQSFKSLIPPGSWKSKQASIAVPAVAVVDSPRFGHRAFLLDIARNFQTKEQIFKTLDLMALYKLNVFHFHFSDDEGWRLEIPGLPELTQVGAKRAHALNDKNFLHPSFGSGPDATTSGTGYYTRQDYIDILRYATRRHIKVIPEIETPGHARAAIAAMDARYERLMREGKKEAAEEYLLYDLKDTSKYRSVQRWFRNVMNPALPSTYRFLEKVSDELIAMHTEAGAPLETIHFGGDEVPSGVWTGSPEVHKLIASDPKVNNVNDAWYYYFDKITKMMKSKGLYVYGWEEAGMRKTRLDGRAVYIPNPDFAATGMQVDVWNNVIGFGAEDLPYQLANAGYRVILSPVSNMYFDLAYQKEFNEVGQYWGGFLDVDKPFKFIPFDYYRNANVDINGNRVTGSFFQGKERLTDYGKENIPGLQGLLWAETLRSPQIMEYLLLPKLLGLAERAWSPDPDWATEKDSTKASQLYAAAWSRFVNVLGKRELPRLDFYAGGFSYRIPTPGAVVRNGMVEANIQFPGLTLRYTTNGQEPNPISPIYKGPIPATGPIKLRLFDTRNRGGRTIEASGMEF